MNRSMGFALFADNDNSWLFTVEEWDRLPAADRAAIARERQRRG